MNLSNDPHQLIGDRIFEQVSGSTGLESAVDILVTRVGCKYDDARIGRVATDGFHRLHPTDPGQAEVDYQNIGLKFLVQRDGFFPDPSRVLQRPTASKFSSMNPTGSISLWHPAQG